MKSTNYYHAFIETAPDSPIQTAEIPPTKGTEKTVANIQFEMINDSPYHYTSDDILFHVYVTKNKIPEKDVQKEREKFFSKGQACFRCSPLSKRYGWGVHSNAEGKIAIYAVESEEYKRYARDKYLKHLKAMQSKRG